MSCSSEGEYFLPLNLTENVFRYRGVDEGEEVIVW